MDSNDAISITRKWLEDIVIGYGLCPFASKVYLEKQIAFIAIDYSDTLLLNAMNESIEEIMSPDTNTSTKLIIVKNGLQNFDDYLNVYYSLEEALKKSGQNKNIQLASFHPKYIFSETSETSPENYSNRSPLPIIHLLKVEDVSRAIDNHPDIHSVASKNIALLQSMGITTIMNIWKEKGFS